MYRADEATLALWREVGEWWSGEPPREMIRRVDAQGVRREEERSLTASASPQGSAAPYTEDHREEWSLRQRKTRDEKVAKYYRSPSAPSRNAPPRVPPAALPYCPLHTFSGYAFGRSAMLADEIAATCGLFGIPAAAIADPFSLVGAVEFAKAAKKAGVKPLIGASIELPEGGEIVLIAKSKHGYTSLSQLITACHLEEQRQYPLGSWPRLERFSRDLICLTGGDYGPINRALIRRDYRKAQESAERLSAIYGRNNVFIEVERSYLPWEIQVNRLLLDLAKELELAVVAGGAVTHARPEHFPVQDVLACIQTLCTVDEVIGRKPPRHPEQPEIVRRPERALNAERFLRTPQEMAELYTDCPELLHNTLQVAERCDEDVLPARTQLPELFPDPAHALREITDAGAFLRHPQITTKLRRRLDYELDRICRLNFAQHFLIAWDACRWASDQDILFSGRGSVVDSAVAYCLGISRIDAFAHHLHFDRFLPEDGSKRPDIDIDFEAKRRDDVRNYLTRKYGQDRVATVAAVGAFCTRGIVREAGKALGLPNELIGYVAKKIHGGVSPEHLEAALEARPELKGANIPKQRLRWIFDLAEQLTDIPRNMRAHSSGVVISSQPLAETVPVMWSASKTLSEEAAHEQEPEEAHLKIIQWDKRSAKHFFDKFDILCLRGQDVLSGTQARIRAGARPLRVRETVAQTQVQAGSVTLAPSVQETRREQEFNVQRIPLDDQETYRAMRSGELIGIPQSASPAMRQAHIRIRTENLHDASLVQAGIRPGVGGAVKLNELIARRRGDKPYTFSHPELERILGLTYGITVFQEQVDMLLQSFCGYSSGEAEDTREAIHERRREDYGRMIREGLIRRMIDRGHPPALAEEVFDLIAGFKGYGFAQGHALAFAEISIRSIYCQQNFPAEYFAALLSAQPAGYYGPCTLVNEARTRGVAILPPDVNRSEEGFKVEDIQSQEDPKIIFPNGGIRIGLMQIAGLSENLKRRIVDSPILSLASPLDGEARFASFFDFVRRIRPERDELEILILCGALDSLHSNRRAMLWAIPTALNDAALSPESETPRLPLEMPEPVMPQGISDFNEIEKAIFERRILDLDVARHIMVYERERVAGRGGIAAEQAKHLEAGRKAIVVGNPIRLRFPPTPSGKRVVFFDLEDETGLLNVTCFDDVYRRDGHAIVCSPYVTIIGEAQDRDGHTAFLAHRVFPYAPLIANSTGNQPLPITTADFLVG
jgi:error-prone DNA polymerase